MQSSAAEFFLPGAKTTTQRTECTATCHQICPSPYTNHHMTNRYRMSSLRVVLMLSVAICLCLGPHVSESSHEQDQGPRESEMESDLSKDLSSGMGGSFSIHLTGPPACNAMRDVHHTVYTHHCMTCNTYSWLIFPQGLAQNTHSPHWQRLSQSATCIELAGPCEIHT